MSDQSTKLTESDLAMLQAAQAQMAAPQAVWNFTAAHLAKTYALGPMDQIQPDGTIVRVKPDEPAAPAATGTEA